MQHEDDESLIRGIDAEHARIAAAQRRMLGLIARIDRRRNWVDSGARDTAHWLAIRYGISYWKARRWIAAGHALESLPRVADALATGELHIDKVAELTRFATPQTESRLLIWAGGVSCGAIRRRADVATRRTRDELVDVERSRCLTWWTFDEGRRFGLQGELPSAQGAVVAKALDRLAADLPVMPDEEGPVGTDARRADALLALCSTGSRPERDPDRATLVLHARMDRSSGELDECEIEDGPAVDEDAARRLACNARRQTVLEDERGLPVRLGRVTREPPAWMVRHLKYRDGECRFPGCGSRRYTQAHHIVWWENGGPTDLENLVLVCTFHHRLVHEYGWRVRRDGDGTVSWFRREGQPYRAGPDPPEQLIAS
ncbi:MAG TPA: DUF222 domain-containing protein [Actinomycetota bacterium]